MAPVYLFKSYFSPHAGILGVVYFSPALNILFSRQGLVPPLRDPFSDPHGYGIRTRTGSKGNHQDPLTRLSLVQDSRKSDQGRPGVNIADPGSEQASFQLGRGETQLLGCPLGEFGVGLMENNRGVILGSFSLLQPIAG